MELYEKKSYLALWKNYNYMKELGFSAHPPSFMVSKQVLEGKKNLSRNQNSEKLSDDEEWTTTRTNSKELLAMETFECVTCHGTFKSNRLWNNHQKNCQPVAEGIVGKHLKNLKESDLSTMGIKTGPRIDILNYVQRHTENNENTGSDQLRSSEGEFGTVSSVSLNNTERHLSAHTPALSTDQPISVKQRVISRWRQSSIFSIGETSTPNISEDPRQTNTPGSSDGTGILLSNPTNRADFSNRSITHAQDSLWNEASPDQPVEIRQLSSLDQNNCLNDGSSSQILLNYQNTAVASGSRIQQPTLSGIPNQMNYSTPFSPVIPSELPTTSTPSSLVENGQTQLSNSQAIESQRQMPSSVNRRPLAPIQAREVRVRVASDPAEILPNSKDPNYTTALNSESRVNRLMTDAVSNLKHKYDVKSIIKASRGGAAVVEILDKGGFVFGPQRMIAVNALVNYLYCSVPSPSLVSTIMRECMAIRVVTTWPALQMNLYSQQDRPWHHWYNAEQNMGYLENATATNQKNNKRSGNGGQRKSKGGATKKRRKLVEAPVQDENHAESDSEEYKNDVSEAKNLMPSSREKGNILQLMISTFERRRFHIAVKQVDTFKVLTQFPHFLNFGGDVIEQEFNMMFEQRESCFLTTFVYEMAPKLLKIAENDSKKYSSCTTNSSDVIKAILVLAKMLPTPIRTFAHEDKMPLQTDLVDFFNIIAAGSDPLQHVARRCAEAQYKIQPHVLAIAHQQTIRKMYLVVDGKLMQLKNDATPIDAIDILVKSFFVFNLHFPLAWKNVLRFLQVHVFQIPLENPRWSIFSEVHLCIKKTPVLTGAVGGSINI